MSEIIYDGENKYIQRIRDLREDHDYTQEYVATRLNTSQTMYARYERGASALPIRHLYYLAKLYNVSTDYILGLTDTPEINVPPEEPAPEIKQPSSKFQFHWKS
jgi:transcriptional regulator with XRE-family HTH domain